MEDRNIKLVIFSAICLILGTSLSSPVYGGEEEIFSATLVDFEGDVSLQKQGEEIWLPVEKDIPLEQGDRIKTGSDAYVEILIDDGSSLRMEENGEITLEQLSADSVTKKIASEVSLWFGRLLSNIAKFTNKGSRFDVQTPTLVAGVRGTEFIVETTDSKQTDVGVFDGEVAVGGLDKDGRLIKESELLVRKGNQTSVLKNKRPKSPFALKERMLSHKKRLDTLRKKTTERRRDLKNIIRKRGKAREKILERWKKTRQDKIKDKNTKRPKKNKVKQEIKGKKDSDKKIEKKRPRKKEPAKKTKNRVSQRRTKRKSRN